MALSRIAHVAQLIHSYGPESQIEFQQLLFEAERAFERPALLNDKISLAKWMNDIELHNVNDK